jgi:hypothetical protein
MAWSFHVHRLAPLRGTRGLSAHVGERSTVPGAIADRVAYALATRLLDG